MRFALVLTVAAAAVTQAATVAHAAWPTDPRVNVPVCTAPGDQLLDGMIPDANGGTFVLWLDNRTGTFQVYGTHVLATGAVDPAWPANGVALGAGAGAQYGLVGVPDGAGGFFAAWSDLRNGDADIYMAHLNASGSRAAGWPASGLRAGATLDVSAAAARDEYPTLAIDATGGVYAAWCSTYNSPLADYNIYATHLTGAGVVVAGWGAGTGTPLDTQAKVQDLPAATSDPAGNLMLVYEDNANGPSHVHGQVRSPDNQPLFNALVVSSAGDQYRPAICSDGGSGALVFYEAYVPDQYSIGVTRFAAWGTPIAGHPVTFAPDQIDAHTVISDGAGGAWLEWQSTTTNLLHVNPAGYPAAGWPAGGIPLPNDPPTSMARDEGDGVIIAIRPGYQPGALRYSSSGQVVAGWDPDGTVSSSGMYDMALVADGRGGAIVAWTDPRNQASTGQDLYVQNVDRFGKLGDASPSIAGVRDVPNDQGGRVRLSWSASYLDASPAHGIASYLVFRQIPASAAASLLARGAARVAAAGVAPTSDGEGVVLRVTSNGTTTFYWEQVAIVPAQMLAGYSLEVATSSDSLGGSNPYTSFMVEAIDGGGAFWQSAPDSGYSVDNRAPGTPAPFTGTFHSGIGTTLAWGPNLEPDLAGYRLYKGFSPAFTPGPGNLLAQVSGATSFTDDGAGSGWYKLSAVDLHGNESGFATLLPVGTTAADDDLPHELSFALASRNPVRGPATLRLAIAEASPVSVRLYDAAGRVVRTLENAERPPGRYTLTWDGTDGAGRSVPSGLYFARLSAQGREVTQRLVVTR